MGVAGQALVMLTQCCLAGRTGARSDMLLFAGRTGAGDADMLLFMERKVLMVKTAMKPCLLTNNYPCWWLPSIAVVS